MKPVIIEHPADDFFPIRYSVKRADGEQTHPCIGREHCEAMLALYDCQEGGDYVIIRRPSKTAPWKEEARIKAYCDAHAEDKAWVRSLVSFQAPNHSPLERVVWAPQWVEMQTRQHLRAIKMTPRKRR